jgi:serine/threonine protein kinase
MNANDGLDVATGNGVGRTTQNRRPWVDSHEAGPDGSASSLSGGYSRPDDPRVIAALEVYLEALREGRPWSRAEFLADHPEISDALLECFSGLEFIETAAAGLNGIPIEPPAPQVEPVLPLHSRLGDYHILREVGRGGMGVVYEARQLSLNRRVALKVLPFSAAVDPKQRQRFQIEAQAAGQLHHPHIVPVFGVGCNHGIHYYVMQFVDGRSLASLIHDLRSGEAASPASAPTGRLAEIDEAPHRAAGSPDFGRSSSTPIEPAGDKQVRNARPVDDPTGDPRTPSGGPPSAATLVGSARQDPAFFRNVARLGIEAAEALDHAHALGILHRDIKPANLLIDCGGSVWITDFGLARFPGDKSLTVTGDIVGTLRYMSPEQALARRGVVDQRTDVYALGATLYELLAMRPAFDGQDHQELLRQIALDEPVPPRRLNPAIPRDLETIVLKAMAKDPVGRYATAQELSEDLKRFLSDEPIMGRRPGPLERSLRWARRRRELVMTAAAIMALSLLIGSAAIWRQIRATREQGRQTEEARNKLLDYIIKNFPLLDRAARDQVEQANMLLSNASGPTTRGQALQMYDQALKLFQQATELPPTDIESRGIIARAFCDLAYSRTLLSFGKGSQKHPEPQLLAMAKADFSRSIAQLETLLNESHDDPTIRRYLADALGLKGMGCYFRFTHCPDEADRYYRRAIEVRRDLLRGTRSAGDGNNRPQLDIIRTRDDANLLLYTIQVTTLSLEQTGRSAKAEEMRRELEDDFVVLAARFSGPEFKSQRDFWADRMMHEYGAFPFPSPRRTMLLYSRLAATINPGNADAHNKAAWVLVSVPEESWFDPKHGLEEARAAVKLEPNNSTFWTTLGVAAFRVQDWKTALDSFKRSIDIAGGSAADWFFVAMTHWKQGNRDEAHKCYNLALAALKNGPKDDPELVRFHVEAATLMGLPVPKSARKTSGATKTEGTGKTGRQKSASAN